MTESSVCHICKKFCLGNCVFCDLCLTWLHPKCLKMPNKIFNALSCNALPYFCPQCTYNIFPFSKLTNFQLKSLYRVKPLNKQSCYKCNKLVNTGNSIFCIQGKHHYHQLCINLSSNSNDNSKHHIWACNQCTSLPFNHLDNQAFLTETITRTKNHKHKLKINLINKLTLMNRQLPLLNIPNPLDEDNETPINFKYYQLNQLINLMNVNSQCFSILHTNIRCYNKNFPHLDTIIKKCSNSFDIIGTHMLSKSIANLWMVTTHLSVPLESARILELRFT